MTEPLQKLTGANMDIDLTTPPAQIEWQQDRCPWNLAENSTQHKCAVKNISICPYFRGIEPLEIVLCSYPNEESKNKQKLKISIQGPFLEKAPLCEPVLRSLPEWFGLEDANQHYLKSINKMPTFLAFDGDQVVGFLTILQHYPSAAEIYVTGVSREYHRCGVGRALLNASEDYLRDLGVQYFQVKTLSDSHPDEGYAKTRAFYRAVGFHPLEEFKTLWGEANPCLLLVKQL